MTKFDGQAHVAANFFLQFFELFASSEKFTGDFILKKRLARVFKLTDFGSAKLDARMLLVVKLFAALMHALVLQTCVIIFEKTLHSRLELEELGIFCDQIT